MAQLKDLLVNGSARVLGKMLIGSSNTYGNTTTPIYWNNGVPTAVDLSGTYVKKAGDTMSGNLIPSLNGSLFLGTPSYVWSSVYTRNVKSDGDLKLFSNAGDGECSITLSGNKQLYPSITNTGSLGLSNYKWNSAYITTINGDKVMINGSSTNYNLYVNGTSYLGGTVTATGLLKAEKGVSVFKSASTYASGSTQMQLATITITEAYINQPIQITYSRRTMSNYNTLTLSFKNSVSVDPGLDIFTHTSEICAIDKSATSTWIIYVPVGSYDYVEVHDVKIPQYIMNAVSITWGSTVSAAPATKTSSSRATLAINSTTAATLTTSRTLTIGSTGKSFNGGSNVSWSLAEIGAYPTSGGVLNGAITLTTDGPYLYSSSGNFGLRVGTTDNYKYVTFNSSGELKVSGTKVSLEGHTHSYLPLSGGTMTGQISKTYISSSWTDGRSGALIRNTADTYTSNLYNPLWSVKSISGTWDCGTYTDNNSLYFTYITDENFNAQVNAPTAQVEIRGSDNSLRANKVYGAVWNDYAEYRKTIQNIAPGRCVIETGDGDLILSTERLQAGGNIVSDTFGFAIGENETTKTPLAVSGRVLAYPLEDRKSYKAGDAVCTGPNGTVSKMSREEIIQYPERIVGTVSEIPNYEVWGSGNVKVNNRIWIKVK